MELLTPDEIVRLSPPERIALIAQLWDSLDADHLPLTAAQSAELESRLASFDQDRQNGVTWTALKAEREQRCPSFSRSFLLRLRKRNCSRRKTGMKTLE